jgi:hypothetical protein
MIQPGNHLIKALHNIQLLFRALNNIRSVQVFMMIGGEWNIEETSENSLWFLVGSFYLKFVPNSSVSEETGPIFIICN